MRVGGGDIFRKTSSTEFLMRRAKTYMAALVTRMHSSGMRTAHLLTVFPRMHCARGREDVWLGGVCLGAGVCLESVCLSSRGVCILACSGADMPLSTDKHL